MVGYLCQGLGVPLIDVTIDYDFTAGDGFALFWSNAPWAIPAAFIIYLLTTRRISGLYLAWVALLASGINEGILTKFHKEPRPDRSCIDGDAMPSGHASLSFAVLVYALLEIIFSLYWSWPRKLWLGFIAMVVCFPIGPMRTHINDHTWPQVAFGWLWGAVWALFNFLVIRFIIHRFLWEPLQTIRSIRWLLQNDYDPLFKYSHWKGRKYADKVPNDRQYKDHHFWDKEPLLLIFYLIIGIANLFLGIFGIIAGIEQKHRDSTCDLASWPVAIGGGILNILTAISMFVLIPLMFMRMEFFQKNVHNFEAQEGMKEKGQTVSKYIFAKHLNPFSLVDLGYLVVFLWVESLTWAICCMYAVNDSNSPCSFNLIIVYAAVWLGQAIIVIVIAVLIFVVWSIFMIYWRVTRGAGRDVNGRDIGERNPRDVEMEVQDS